MKKGSHKNQIIITTLALLLAVVGYISYDNRDNFMNAKDVLSTEIEAVNGKADTKESKECEDTQASDEAVSYTHLPYVPGMVEMMKEKGFAHMSEGALVVDVKEDTDTKDIPPCIILKSDVASLYSTTYLATLVMRMKENNPYRVIYLADARQSMHFIQVFRLSLIHILKALLPFSCSPHYTPRSFLLCC